MVGEGSLEEAAARHAKLSGVSDRVHFLGVRQDVAELLSASELFALAAHWEGSPIAVIEAMAAGLPVVATAVGGVAELVEHGATGLLAPAGDIAALADALACLTRDPQRRAEFSRRARERASRYSVQQMVQSYAALFERVAGGQL
jgi:glycosyltransferase involved in cell wall biosynthesis